MFGIGQRKIVLRPSAAVPGAIGRATVGRDKNGNSTVQLEVWHLARPQDLTPPAETYMVWARAAARPPENKGVLRVNAGLQGDLRFVTAAAEFAIFITAETSSSPSAPSAQEVLRGAVPGAQAA
jgi:hypothetical protein